MEDLREVPSFHDEYLVGYEVDCEARTIKLRIKEEKNQASVSTVTFTGVEGYHFQDDAFGNIINGLDPEPLASFVQEYGSELTESRRMSGAPGAWADDLERAPKALAERGVRAFVLSQSYGMSGWLLAREVSVVRSNGSSTLEER